jgi:hypothetical protein
LRLLGTIVIFKWITRFQREGAGVAHTHHKEVKVMMLQRIAPAVILMVGIMVISAPIASTEEVKYNLKPAATMKTLLTDSLGKRVVVRLESGEELEGGVTMVGEHLVHLSKLSRRDFFDAFINIDRISAVIVRAR